MPKLPTIFDGTGYESSYAGLHAELFNAADSANGRVLVPPPTEMYFPRLSNLQLVALVQAWRRATQRAGAAPVIWRGWYDLLTAAFGWEHPGDHFDDTTAHMKAPAPPELLAMFWQSTDKLATDLDGAHVALRALRPRYTADEYRQAERDAWEQMRGMGIAPPDLGPPLANAANQIDIAPSLKSSGGGGGLLLLIVIAVVALESK